MTVHAVQYIGTTHMSSYTYKQKRLKCSFISQNTYMAYLFKSVDRIKVYGVLTGGLAAGPRVNSVTG